MEQKYHSETKLKPVLEPVICTACMGNKTVVVFNGCFVNEPCGYCNGEGKRLEMVWKEVWR